jgi:hypothetical protein
LVLELNACRRGFYVRKKLGKEMKIKKNKKRDEN